MPTLHPFVSACRWLLLRTLPPPHISPYLPTSPQAGRLGVPLVPPARAGERVRVCDRGARAAHHVQRPVQRDGQPRLPRHLADGRRLHLATRDGEQRAPPYPTISHHLPPSPTISQVNSVHLYHMLGGFVLSSADYFHHLLFVPLLGFPGHISP